MQKFEILERHTINNTIMSKKPLPKNQSSIDALFKKAEPATNKQKPTSELMSETPEIQAFYNSLNKAEQIAHLIAFEKLGTSYDVARTHGYIKWKKSQITKQN